MLLLPLMNLGFAGGQGAVPSDFSPIGIISKALDNSIASMDPINTVTSTEQTLSVTSIGKGKEREDLQ